MASVGAGVLGLLVKAPSVAVVEQALDTCFRHRHNICEAQTAPFTEATGFHTHQAVSIFKELCELIRKALYFSPFESQGELDKIFPEGELEPRLKGLLSKIVMAKLSMWRSSAASQRVSLPQLVSFDWRVDLKASSEHMNNMAVPVAMLNLKVREQPTRADQIPGIRTAQFEMSKETVQTVLTGLGNIRDQLSQMKT